MVSIPTSILAAPHVLFGLGIAQMSSQDDVYEGHLIPTGTVTTLQVRTRLTFWTRSGLKSPMPQIGSRVSNVSNSAYVVRRLNVKHC